MSAVEKGRSAIALHNDSVALEELGNYLRTIALQSDESYRLVFIRVYGLNKMGINYKICIIRF